MENLLDWDGGFCSIAAKKLFFDFIPTIDYIEHYNLDKADHKA
jgi:hypothetical protein